jgi:hypothetical protein
VNRGPTKAWKVRGCKWPCDADLYHRMTVDECRARLDQIATHIATFTASLVE